VDIESLVDSCLLCCVVVFRDHSYLGFAPIVSYFIFRAFVLSLLSVLYFNSGSYYFSSVLCGCCMIDVWVVSPYHHCLCEIILWENCVCWLLWPFSFCYPCCSLPLLDIQAVKAFFQFLFLSLFWHFFLLYGMLWWVVVRDVPYGPRPVLDIWVLNLIWFWYLYRHIFYWSCTVFLTFLFWETAPCLLLACYGCWLIGFGDQLLLVCLFRSYPGSDYGISFL